ncbi:pyridoxamine 5'-phosphate oxidase family protein [Burkholderia sp. Ax-1719]|uniref:HugZ family pyridoxamine 5'-phosphate oxidase n=1 Tax=Burkholderia sp. Ax-1719 TaxID=2608334 RepID=UPI0014224E5D|nr:pyridoxamine 5'-phosphate oxidase family protein [Burkholderia sp. Ax-1719]NIE66694.1 pyridoxamine 5'-phosphate oxidase [Burkholderia sp. Ax-1719]
MKIPAHAPLHLLHQAPVGTLATHAREPQGFPYPTLLPFATDARHRPVILVSRLAEHTRNLQDDPRAGFLVAQTSGEDVLSAPRMTLIGRFEPSDAGADSTLARRYLRYHPDAARYLALGDFTFWTLHVERLRYIGGFGAMGWLDGAELDTLVPVPAEEEDALIHFADTHPARREGFALLGVDRHGADLRIDGQRIRHPFELPQLDGASLHGALADSLAAYSN